MKEIWKDISGFEGLYQVSNYGNVKALERLVLNNGGVQRKHERTLKQNMANRHCIVVLCKDGKTYPKLVHRLVAIAFIPNPENKPVVDHIDTNPSNNRVDNLRWVTVQENCMNPITRKKNSESKKGHPYYGRPLTDEEKNKIRQKVTGQKRTEEQKKRMSEAHKNSAKVKQTSRANIKKAHQSNIGRILTDETKKKIQEKMIGVHKRKHWKVVNGKRVWYKEGE